jgi:hypothetical protein
MAERAAEKPRQSGQEAAELAREITGRGLWVVAQRGGATEGRGQFLALIRDDMAGQVGASQALVSAISELSYAWLVFWHEQVAEGMKATGELLERQNAFTRSSLERAHVRMRRSAELAGEMITGSFQPMRESAHEVAEHASKPAA